MSDAKTNLPVLEHLISTTKWEDIDKHQLIAIQHLLNDTLTFLLHLQPHFSQILAIGIPYSNRDEVIKILQKNKITVNAPQLTELENSSYLVDIITRMLNSEKKSYLILEDGGYIGECLHNNSRDSLATCIGAVEQTKAGLWKYEKLKKNGLLTIPVYTVANSELKDLAEAPEVGEAVIRNLEILLKKLGIDFTNKVVTILGYGWIGSNTAKALRRRTENILVFDVHNIRMVKARLDRFTTSDFIDVIRKADIIIGCTGTRSLESQFFKDLKNNVVLVNATSKRVEFDMDWLNKNTEKKLTSDGSIYELDSKNIVVLADGTPINFFVGESVPPQIMDMIISEMFVCIRNAIQRTNTVPDVYSVSTTDEENIAKTWLSFNGDWLDERQKSQKKSRWL